MKMLRSHWAPPAVERAAVTLTQVPVHRYVQDTHFRLVTMESGSVRNDIPIWSSLPNAVQFDLSGWGPVRKTDVPDVPGAFVLSNVLTPVECEQLIALSETMGYTSDAPVSLGRDIRQSEPCLSRYSCAAECLCSLSTYR